MIDLQAALFRWELNLRRGAPPPRYDSTQVILILEYLHKMV